MSHTITRRKLYAAGEAFGESATRREPGRMVCGGGDSTSAQNITDRRVAVQDGIGVSGDGNTTLTATSYNITDGGIVSRGLDTVDRSNARAFDSIDRSNATLNDGYTRLIAAADSLFARGESMIGQTQQHVADAYLQANTDAKGTIDNKTLIALAVAGVAAAAAIAYAGKK